MSAAEQAVTTPPCVSLDDPRLWNKSQLAEKLGVNRAYVSKMVKTGFKMPLGKASLAMAHKFLEENADVLKNKKVRD